MIFQVVATGGLLLVLGGCAGATKLDSGWQDGEVVVDGTTSDWSGQFQAIADEKIDVGVMNDQEYLYVAVVTSDREVRHQILSRGLVLWFDPTGEKIKRFGIQYPLGVMAGQTEPRNPEQMRQMRQTDPEQRLEQLAADFSQISHQLRLRSSPASDGMTMSLEEMPGLEVDTYLSESVFACEMKIPLRSSREHPWAIGCADGKKLHLGIQTPAINMSAMRGQMMAQRGSGGGGFGRGGGPGGGRGGMGGGMKGGMGGSRPGGIMGRGPGGQRPNMAEPVDTWVTVQLVTAPVANEE
jgi:hypothetical protein